MDLGFLKDVYTPPGPYATVYLGTSHAREDQVDARALRWRAAREQLAGSGADAATLDAVEAVLPQERAAGERGRVVCASGGSVLLDDVLYDPAEAAARWAPLPDLLPYLTERAGRLPYASVLVDRTGADIVSASVAGIEAEEQVNTDRHPLTKVRGGDEANKRYHRRVEGVWDNVAERIADEVTKQVLRTAPAVVVLGGDPHMRGLVNAHLDPRVGSLVVTTDTGGRGAGAAGEPLSAELADAVRRKAAEREEATVSAFTEARGRDGAAVSGLAPTVEALRRAQVDTLLLTPAARDTFLYVGRDSPAPGLTENELYALGETDVTRTNADAALLRAGAATDARLHVPERSALPLDDGVGALLRYTD